MILGRLLNYGVLGSLGTALCRRYYYYYYYYYYYHH